MPRWCEIYDTFASPNHPQVPIRSASMSNLSFCGEKEKYQYFLAEKSTLSGATGLISIVAFHQQFLQHQRFLSFRVILLLYVFRRIIQMELFTWNYLDKCLSSKQWDWMYVQTMKTKISLLTQAVSYLNFLSLKEDLDTVEYTSERWYCLCVFYGPANPLGLCWEWSVYLTTLSPGQT